MKNLKLKREKLFRKQGGRCADCGKECHLPRPFMKAKETWCHDLFTVEHLKPKSEGGTSKWSNITGLCFACNVGKSMGQTPTQVREAERARILALPWWRRAIGWF